MSKVADKKYSESSVSPTWTSERLYSDGDSYFSSLLAGIAAARLSIDLESYIFRDDRLGKRIESALCAAAGRGVQVRVLVDGFGSQGWTFGMGRRLRESGIKVKIYHQLPWERLISKPSLEFRRLGQLLKRINRRDHRKVSIIDGTTAWVGSLNVMEQVSAEFVGANAWRELGISVSGAGVECLRSAFDLAWYVRQRGSFRLRRRARRMLVDAESSGVRVNPTRRLRLRNNDMLLDRFDRAAKRIWIANAYFVPSGSMIEALTAAADRGVDVRIIASKQSDVFFMPWVHSAFQQALVKTRIKNFSFAPAFLHAKYMLIDDWGMVGSSNLNQRSFLHDLEADVLVEQKQTLIELGKEFEKDLSRSKQLRIEAISDLPFWQRAFGRLALLFKRFL